MASLALRDRLAHLADMTPGGHQEVEPSTSSAYKISTLESNEIAANRHVVFEDGYFSQFESLKQKVNEIENHVRHISHLHGELLVKAVAPESQRKELEGIMEKVSKLARQVQASIKTTGRKLEQECEDEATIDADSRMHKVQYNAVIKRFNGIMDQYQQEQATYRSRCKERIKRQLKIVGREKDDNEIDDMLNLQNPNIFIDEFGAQKLQQSRQALDEIEQRHKDIIQLEENMRELQEMFDELARLIEEQGDIIDRIDAHVETAKEYVHKAEEQVRIAVDYHKKSKKKLYIIICIISSVVAVILIGIVIVIAIAAGVASQ